MPGFEYDTIVTKVDGVGQKIDTEIVDKKFESGDVDGPFDEILSNLNPAIAILGGLAIAPLAIPLPSNANNVVSLDSFRQLKEVTTNLKVVSDAGKGATGTMTQGGIRSILNFGKAILPLVARVVAVVAVFAAVAYEIYHCFSTIGESVSHLYEAKAALEVKVGGFEAKINKISAENKALKTGMATLEKSLNLQIKEQVTKIQILEAEMAGLETLIQNNHTESMAKATQVSADVTATKTAVTSMSGNVSAIKTDTSDLLINTHNDFLSVGTSLINMNTVFSQKLTSIETKQTTMDELNISKWAANEIWQENNRAAVTATITAAALEAPGRPLAQIQQSTLTTQSKVEKALEGIPSEAASDAEYTAAIVGGTAVAAGTVGYAVHKATNGGFKDLKNKMTKLGSMIDVGRIMDVITLIMTIHNAAMLSRNLFETCIRVVDNGLNAALNAFGIKDIDDEGVNSSKALSATFDAIGKQIFGLQTWTEITGTWAKFNRIVTTGNTLLWSVRDLFDNTQNLAELAAENSAKVANLLRRAGAIYDKGPWFPENYNHRTVLHKKMAQLEQFFQNANNTAQIFEEFTETTLEIQENIKEIKENNDNFQKALKESPKKETKENDVIKAEEAANKTSSASVDVPKEQLTIKPTTPPTP